MFTGINSLFPKNIVNKFVHFRQWKVPVKLESGSCLTRLANYLNANALREVAQLTEITFTGAGIVLYLNVVCNLELRDHAFVMKFCILTRVA